jgi:hypothetical protein
MADTYTREQVLDIVEETAKRNAIPTDDFLRFSYIETGGTFNPNARNVASGAKGLFQFMPGTAKQYGISGDEFDPKLNAEAGAQLYSDNRAALISAHAEDNLPYLSGAAQPCGVDLYIAHQQGAAGYHSIQDGIATGTFSDKHTRHNILNNVSTDDARAFTGSSKDELAKMSDADMAKTFAKYWEGKFAVVSIPEKNVVPTIDDPRHSSQSIGGGAHVLKEGARSQEVYELQTNLAALGYAVKADKDFGPHTKAAVEQFQADHHLAKDGVAGRNTLNAIQDDLNLQKGSTQESSLDDPRNPASPHHDLFNTLKDRIPDASENRLLQFTAACQGVGINNQNLDKIVIGDRGLVGLTSGGWMRDMAVVDIKQPSPPADQSIQQIQQNTQQQATQAQLQAQQTQIDQQQQGLVLDGHQMGC